MNQFIIIQISGLKYNSITLKSIFVSSFKKVFKGNIQYAHIHYALVDLFRETAFYDISDFSIFRFINYSLHNAIFPNITLQNLCMYNGTRDGTGKFDE